MTGYRPSSFLSFAHSIPPFSRRDFFASSTSIRSSISSRSFRSSPGTRTAPSFPRPRRTIRSPLYATRFRASENSSLALLASIRVIVVASPDGIIRTIRTYWQYMRHRPPLPFFGVAPFFLFWKRQRLSPRAGKLISSQAGGGPHGPSEGSHYRGEAGEDHGLPLPGAGVAAQDPRVPVRVRPDPRHAARMLPGRPLAEKAPPGTGEGGREGERPALRAGLRGDPGRPLVGPAGRSGRVRAREVAHLPARRHPRVRQLPPGHDAGHLTARLLGEELRGGDRGGA